MQQADFLAFGGLNYTVLGLYLSVLVLLGYYFSRRESSTNNYFKAGGRIPWWAAGLSIAGTSISAITFMAVPAKTYATDWRYLMMSFSIVLAAPVIMYLFIPFYRRLNVTSAYEYLEKRFNRLTRLVGSVSFMLLQLGRIGIVLYLPSIALSVVTGVDIYACILVIGGLSVLYTVMGGIEAVIWTDVIQVVVLVSGAFLCLLIMGWNIEGGWATIMEVALSDDKIKTFDFTFDIRTPTFWVVVLGGFAINIVSQGSDQTTIQRYLITKNESAAKKGVLINAIISVPISLLFFSLGTLLYVFFKMQPELVDAAVIDGDAIFPYYIVTQLPDGISGLLIAGIFAAAMSSLDSSLNSIATVVTTDFLTPLRPGLSDKVYVKFARWVTLIAGVAGTVMALAMAGWEIKSSWDMFNKIIGLFAGGLAGLFLLGILSRKANGTGALIGFFCSAGIQYWLSQTEHIHLLLFSLTGIISCMTIGYLASWLLPGDTKNIKGLTIYTLEKEA